MLLTRKICISPYSEKFEKMVEWLSHEDIFDYKRIPTESLYIVRNKIMNIFFGGLLSLSDTMKFQNMFFYAKYSLRQNFFFCLY